MAKLPNAGMVNSAAPPDGWGGRWGPTTPLCRRRIRPPKGPTASPILRISADSPHDIATNLADVAVKLFFYWPKSNHIRSNLMLATSCQSWSESPADTRRGQQSQPPTCPAKERKEQGLHFIGSCFVQDRCEVLGHSQETHAQGNIGPASMARRHGSRHCSPTKPPRPQTSVISGISLMCRTVRSKRLLSLRFDRQICLFIYGLRCDVMQVLLNHCTGGVLFFLDIAEFNPL